MSHFLYITQDELLVHHYEMAYQNANNSHSSCFNLIRADWSDCKNVVFQCIDACDIVERELKLIEKRAVSKLRWFIINRELGAASSWKKNR